jgi:hypothetical protein
LYTELEKDPDYQYDMGVLTTFDSKYIWNEKENKYEDKKNKGVFADEATVAEMTAAREKIGKYQSFGLTAEEAEATAAALSLINNSVDSSVKKFERMHGAISKLPSDMEEFNKLVK